MKTLSTLILVANFLWLSSTEAIHPKCKMTTLKDSICSNVYSVLWKEYIYKLDTLSDPPNYIQDIQQARWDQESQKMELEVIYNWNVVPIKVEGSTIYVWEYIYAFECEYLFFHIKDNIQITKVEKKEWWLYIQVKWRAIWWSTLVSYEEMETYLKRMLSGYTWVQELRNRKFVKIVNVTKK